MSTSIISNFQCLAKMIDVLRWNGTQFIISYDLEHWGAIKSEHSRLAKQTLSNW